MPIQKFGYMKQFILILTILLPVFSFGQNLDMAKAYYEKAGEAYNQRNYQKAIDYLENAKGQLGTTNPDIMYLEVKSRFALGKLDDKIELLVADFFKKSNADDPKRTEVSVLLINYREKEGNLRKKEEKRMLEEKETLLKEEKLRLKKEKDEQKRIEEIRTIEEKLKDAPDIINSLEADMVFVEGGTFKMGSNKTLNMENYKVSIGRPMHKVTLNSFRIGKYPVTQAQWFAVMHSFPGDLEDKDCNDCPITYVSWNDAQDFLKKLNGTTGKAYRLPTESEWEFSARGGNQSKGYEYSGSNTLDEVGWYIDNRDKKVSFSIVGQKKSNELGIYDMSGSVMEWCMDYYGDSYYDNSPKDNPKGPSSGAFRIRRGGTTYSSAQECHVSYRSFGLPHLSINFQGFRVALSQ